MVFAIAAVNVKDNSQKLYLQVGVPDTTRWTHDISSAKDFFALDDTKWWWENCYKKSALPQLKDLSKYAICIVDLGWNRVVEVLS